MYLGRASNYAPNENFHARRKTHTLKTSSRRNEHFLLPHIHQSLRTEFLHLGKQSCVHVGHTSGGGLASDGLTPSLSAKLAPKLSPWWKRREEMEI